MRYSDKVMDLSIQRCPPLPPPPPPNPNLLSVQVRWTKTAGSASDKFQETSIYNETLRIEGIQRVQGGRYYCKADNGVGVAAIKSIRVDVQCKWARERRLHFQTTADCHCSYSHRQRWGWGGEMERLGWGVGGGKMKDRLDCVMIFQVGIASRSI